jgi:two-component system response regulator AtoC
MSSPIALLVSKDSAVIESVATACAPIDQLRFRTCPDLNAAAPLLRVDNVGLVLAHLQALGDEAAVTRLLWAVAAARRPCATLVLANSYSQQQANALFRAGASDYLELPVDTAALGDMVDALTRRLRLAHKDEHLPAPEELPGMATHDDGLAALLAQARRVAPLDTTLLLTGETGTGKTRLARVIHELSPRREGPFLVIDCGSLSASLIESELFGHARGAFTGADRDRLGKLAAAGQGTLLLDEVNSLPLPLQSKLLRAVDERVFEPVGSNRSQPMKARLIAASNADLGAEVAAGRFRADLYHRLNVVGFYLPPLRDRRESVGPLARRFLAELAASNRPDVVDISVEALAALAAHSWPGNVRELRNALERAVALCDGPEVTLADLPLGMQSAVAPVPVAPPAPLRGGPGRDTAPTTLAQSKEAAEVRHIQDALRRHNNNRLRAAADLGISRMALYKKLHKYGLTPPSSPTSLPRSGD